MKITEALKSLESSWSREDILLKIKNGKDSEKIVTEFINTNELEIETLTNYFNKEDKTLLSELEELSNIESKLINKIKNYSFNNLLLIKDNEMISNPKPFKPIEIDLGRFMIKWSNKFVFFALIVISAVALTKQAWV